MVAKVDGWLPRDHAPVVRKLARDIDKVLAGFVARPSYGLPDPWHLLCGLIDAGRVAVRAGWWAPSRGPSPSLPYVGRVESAGSLAIGLALFQFWGHWVSIAIVIGIFALGQFLEGNIISPKLVGSSVGLHPLWLIFALTAFGSVFGFVGMLVAVPFAAMIGVLARFGIERYQQSRLYQGQEHPEARAGEED